MHNLQFSADNPLVCALRDKHITLDYIVNMALHSGYENANDFLAQFEPKQKYKEADSGTGNGTTASEVQHYINLMPEGTVRVVGL